MPMFFSLRHDLFIDFEILLISDTRRRAAMRERDAARFMPRALCLPLMPRH